MNIPVLGETQGRPKMARMQCPKCRGWLQFQQSDKILKGNCRHCGGEVQSVRQLLAPIPALGSRIKMDVSSDTEAKVVASPFALYRTEIDNKSQIPVRKEQEDMILLRDTMMSFTEAKENPEFKNEFVPTQSTADRTRMASREFQETKDSKVLCRKKPSRMSMLFRMMGILTVFGIGMSLMTSFQSQDSNGLKQLVGMAKKLIEE